MRGDNPRSEAIGLGLQDREIRALLLPWLRSKYRAGGGTQVGFARELGVTDRAIRRWIATRPELRNELDPWNQADLHEAIRQSAAGSRQERILSGELPWSDASAAALLRRIRSSLHRWGYGHCSADVYGDESGLRLVVSDGKREYTWAATDPRDELTEKRRGTLDSGH